MGILSGMLFAAVVAFFSKKKLAAQKKEADIKKELTPQSEHKKETIDDSIEPIKSENASIIDKKDN